MSETTITREAAAKRLGCSMRTVERMLRDGRLQAIRHPDGRLAVDRADLELVLREPKLLETRRARSDATPHAEPPVVTITAQADPDRLALIRDPEPSRRSLLERVTPLSPEPVPIPPATEEAPVRHAARSSRRHPAIAIATALALAAPLVWLLAPSGSPHQKPSGKSATQHHETPAPTLPTGSTIPRSAATTGGREHPAPSPTSRGGFASLIVPPSPTRLGPVSRTDAAVPPTDVPAGNTPTKPSSVSVNCGFGSLTYAGCRR